MLQLCGMFMLSFLFYDSTVIFFYKQIIQVVFNKPIVVKLVCKRQKATMGISKYIQFLLLASHNIVKIQFSFN